jgi:hypothetical protein
MKRTPLADRVDEKPGDVLRVRRDGHTEICGVSHDGILAQRKMNQASWSYS